MTVPKRIRFQAMPAGLAVLLLLLLETDLAAGSLVRVGSEFPISNYVFAGSFGTRAIVLADGSYVVVWGATVDAPPPFEVAVGGILARRFSRSGEPFGEEFWIGPAWSTTQPVAAAAVDGGFAVGWVNQGVLLVRRFDARGRALEIVGVASAHEDNNFSTPTRPALASDDSGNSIVVWSHNISSKEQVFAERFDSRGSALEGAFAVSEMPGNGDSAVVRQPDDGFVVVWDSHEYAEDVFGRRFDSLGNPTGPEIQINQAARNAYQLDMCSGANGCFVVVWDGEYYDWHSTDTVETVWARVFNSDGQAVTDEIRLQSENHARAPAVACTPDGRFVVAWSNERGSTLARDFSSAGQPMGPAVPIQARPSHFSRATTLAIQQDGGFLAVWFDREQGRILGQLFDPSMASCNGDCDGSGEVTINELLVGVDIALSGQDLPVCFAMDANADGSVGVEDLVEAVGNAVDGCPETNPHGPPTAEGPLGAGGRSDRELVPHRLE